jgi:hypothetical protein
MIGIKLITNSFCYINYLVLVLNSARIKWCELSSNVKSGEYIDK